jgi:hypothetical protein
MLRGWKKVDGLIKKEKIKMKMKFHKFNADKHVSDENHDEMQNELKA